MKLIRSLFIVAGTILSLLFSCFAVRAEVFLSVAPVNLQWSPNAETDIQGYEVHRATAYDGPYVKVNSGVTTSTSWQDWGITASNTYYYRICAVDIYGNKSSLSAPSEAVVISSGDFDADGFADTFEEAIGTDPLDANSRPAASVLVLTPEQPLLRIGGAESFSVLGLFESQTGETIEHDMTCGVEYHTSQAGIVSVNACGSAIGQAEGNTDVWAWQTINGQTVAASNQTTITVDGSAPYVNSFETQPYDGQGIQEDTNSNGILDPGEDLDGDGVLDQDTGPTPRVPIDSGIIIRVADDPVGDNVGIDEQSIHLTVNGTDVPAKVKLLQPGDFHEIDIAWTNTGVFNYDAIVIVDLSLADAAGNSLSFRESFKAESASQHQWALDHLPVQTMTDLGGGTCEVAVTPLPDGINDEPLESAKIVFSCDEPVPPRFGPVDEVAPVDIATPAGVPISIEPITVFDSPVTVSVPTPGANLEDTDADGIPDTGLQNYLLYQYTSNPSVLWRETSETSGWFVEGSRLDQYGGPVPVIQAQLARSGGIQAAKDAGGSPPVADIKANGQDGPVTVTADTPLSITVTFNPVERYGQLADWWAIADTPKGRYFYRLDRHKWVKRLHVAVQKAVADTASTEIFGGIPPFGAGDYTICFGVDANADGRPDLDWQDTVVVQVRN